MQNYFKRGVPTYQEPLVMITDFQPYSDRVTVDIDGRWVSREEIIVIRDALTEFLENGFEQPPTGKESTDALLEREVQDAIRVITVQTEARERIEKSGSRSALRAVKDGRSL